MAIQIASDPAALRSASAELKGQVFSKTNRHSVAIKLGTWVEIAVAAGYSDPYGLSVDMLYDVAAALWKAKYRSVDSYLTVARQEMILKHGSIPESLLLHFRRVSSRQPEAEDRLSRQTSFRSSGFRNLATLKFLYPLWALASQAGLQSLHPGGC